MRKVPINVSLRFFRIRPRDARPGLALAGDGYPSTASLRMLSSMAWERLSGPGSWQGFNHMRETAFEGISYVHSRRLHGGAVGAAPSLEGFGLDAF
jgi:hypothetical protein